MKKDINDTLLPITQEEFCNIMDLWTSPDKECKILAEELLKPYVYSVGDTIFLTEDFSINSKFGGWFSRSDGCWSGPRLVYKEWMRKLENTPDG